MRISDSDVEMLKQEVARTNGISQEQRERWLIIKQQFKISKQLNRIEAMLEKAGLER